MSDIQITLEKCIKVIETEKQCVLRASQEQCDRQCDKCDLVMDDKVIIAAYDKVLKHLKDIKELKKMYE